MGGQKWYLIRIKHEPMVVYCSGIKQDNPNKVMLRDLITINKTKRKRVLGNEMTRIK